ncbi:formate dehydrogenase subunit gamma [Caldinitratiruptor microaerophilus]|uniref:Formate dehydrogenase n=1 Tax=Caldinitratiruptor microaerophilus TaxID=671077 RepID=A0AA35G980_9FIRM|nr:cytochrome b/b6 domain-containing protein [Caldinitratiruptor microaerophilus]BDG61173.1 formate dehydrogenase [Caldinitratiruptor microaerophilus]
MERVRKFSPIERGAHWALAVTFFILVLTGVPLYAYGWFGWLAPLFGGMYGARVVHHWAGAAFTAILALAVVGGFRTWTAHVLRWDADDRAWRRYFLAYFFGLVSGSRLPPQGKYNAGQKAWSAVLIAGGLVLLGSGLIMLFPNLFPVGLVRWMYPLHGLTAMGLLAYVIGHVFLAAFHRETRVALSAMTSGWVDRRYLETHHAKWLEELGRTEKAGAAGGKSGA